MDEIRIDNLKVYAYHGVYAEENEKGQDFYVNAVLYTDTRTAGQKDILSESTNYGEVCEFINNFLKLHTFQLIETVAEQTAEQVLLHFPLVKALDLEIRKPQAPIALPFESVSVKIHRGWHKTYVAVGSNMGEKEKQIEKAKLSIKENKQIRNLKSSSLITTKPYGEVQEQEDFLNGMFAFETLFSPQELLDFLQEIEKAANRVREVHWGPRTLDLDIILYDNMVVDSETLTIPHADMHNREFVLKPLCQIAPFVRHPLLHKTAAQMYRELRDRENM